MKRSISLLIVLILLFTCGCASGTNMEDQTISVIQGNSRSGLMHCFNSMMTLADIDSEGNFSYRSTGKTTDDSEQMLTSVASEQNSIGYTLFSRLDDTVKAIKVNEVEPSKKNVENGTYMFIAPVNVITSPENENAVVRDFKSWIFSSFGTDIIKEYGIFPLMTDASPFESKNVAGELKIITSSSWTPLVNKLVDEYEKVNTTCVVTVTEYDSQTAISFLTDGAANFAFITRELFESENAKGLENKNLAYDGVAVIVNKKNSIKDMTQKDLISVFSGERTKW